MNRQKVREELYQVQKELERRKAIADKPPVSFLDKKFKIQYECATDKVLLKAVQCTRRSGKSTGEVKSQLQDMVDFPGTKHMFMALTLDSAKFIAWDIIVEELDKQSVEYKTNEQRGVVTLKNGPKGTFEGGSMLRLFGLDASYKQMKKVLGTKLKSVKIDEAGSMTQDLRVICYQMILPALADLEGTLTLLGTAENIPGTFFEKVTSGEEPGWKVYKWTAYDNPYMKVQWTKLIETIRSTNPKFMETSEFKTHYLNQWVADSQKLIIKMSPDTLIKKFRLEGYDYVLGVDLGYNDASSFTVIAHSTHDPSCYIIYSKKNKEMDLTDVANEIKRLKKLYPISITVVDGANKQGIQEMIKRHKVSLIIAEKTDKAMHLRLLRDDVIQGKVKIFNEECVDLKSEWESLMWKDDQKDKEDPRCQNHCSDGALYAWRYTRNFSHEPTRKKPQKDTDEFMKEFEKKEQERLRKQMEEESEYTLVLRAA